MLLNNLYIWEVWNLYFQTVHIIWEYSALMMVKLQFQKVSNLKLDYLEKCVLCCVAQLGLRENGDDMFSTLLSG